MSLYGVQIVENSAVPVDQIIAVMPLGGSFRKPEGFDEWPATDRLRYAVEQGAIVCVNPASNPWSEPTPEEPAP